MEKDLKTQNVPSLTAIYVGALMLVAFVHWSVEEVFDFSLQLGQQTLLVAAITTFGGVLSNFLPNTMKHPLVYMRFHNVLSGHRCRRICTRDTRLRLEDLERKWPELFKRGMKEVDQNAYWYREIYRPVRNDPEVLQAHRSFLLYRDAAAGLSVLVLGLTLWSAASEAVPLPSVSIWSLFGVFGLVLLLCQAARQSGDRMVANAVAVTLGR